MKTKIKIHEDLSEEDKKALTEAFENMTLSGCIESKTPKERLKRILSRLLG